MRCELANRIDCFLINLEEKIRLHYFTIGIEL